MYYQVKLTGTTPIKSKLGFPIREGLSYVSFRKQDLPVLQGASSCIYSLSFGRVL